MPFEHKGVVDDDDICKISGAIGILKHFVKNGYDYQSIHESIQELEELQNKLMNWKKSGGAINDKRTEDRQDRGIEKAYSSRV